MNREQAQLILDHLDLVKHFAAGGMLEHHGCTCTGVPTTPTPVLKGLIINCLPRYRKVDQFIEPKRTQCSRWCPHKHTNKPKIPEDAVATAYRTLCQTKRPFKDTLESAINMGFVFVYSHPVKPTWTPVAQTLQENWWVQIDDTAEWIMQPLGYRAMVLINTGWDVGHENVPECVHLTKNDKIIR